MDIEIPRKNKFFTIKNLIAIGIFTLAVILYFQFNNEVILSSHEIEINDVRYGDLNEKIIARGVLESAQKKLIVAEVDGIVEEIFIKAGQKVMPTTPIIQLANPELKDALLSQKLEVERTKIDNENAKLALEAELFELEAAFRIATTTHQSDELKFEAINQLTINGMISKIELKKLQSDIKVSEIKARVAQERFERATQQSAIKLKSFELNIQQAMLKLDNLTLKNSKLKVISDFEGIIESFVDSIELGSRLTTGSSIAKASEVGAFFARLSVPSRNSDSIKVNKEITININGTKVLTRISEVDGAVQEGRVWFTSALLSDFPKDAKPNIEINAELHNLIRNATYYVKNNGLFEEYKKQIAYVSDDNIFKAVEISFGKSTSNFIEVLDGIKQGQQIITDIPKSILDKLPATIRVE